MFIVLLFTNMRSTYILSRKIAILLNFMQLLSLTPSIIIHIYTHKKNHSYLLIIRSHIPFLKRMILFYRICILNIKYMSAELYK